MSHPDIIESNLQKKMTDSIGNKEYLNDFKLSIHNFTFHMAIILPLLSNKQL